MTPWTVACQAPLSIGFPSQEHWSGLPFPSPSDLPNPGIKPTSLTLAGGLFIPEPPGKPSIKWGSNFIILHVINQLSQHHLLKTAPFPTECLWLLWHDKNAIATVAIVFLGPKVHSDFSITSYGKTQRNFSGQTNIIQHINISKQHGVHLKMYPMLCINIYCS